MADIPKTCYKKLVTHVESRASAVSLLENREQCYIKAINNNYRVLHNRVVNIVCQGNWRSLSRLHPAAVFSSASSQSPALKSLLPVIVSGPLCVQQCQLPVSCFEKPASCHCFWTTLCTNKIKTPSAVTRYCFLCFACQRARDWVYLHQPKFTD